MQVPDPLNKFFTIISLKKFYRRNLSIEWHNSYPQLSTTRKQLEDHFWESYLEQHPELPIFDGTLCQLIKYNFNSEPIHLTFAPIKFKTHLFSLKKGTEVSDKEKSPPMGLGVSAVVLSSDNQIIFMKRSNRVAGNPGQFDVFGGHIDPDQDESSLADEVLLPDPFVAIKTELQEELNLISKQVADLTGLGLITNNFTGQPELIFRCITNIDTDKIFNQANKAQDKLEYSHLIQIPNNQEKLHMVCHKYAQDFSPSGLASLWLFYLYEKGGIEEYQKV